MCDVSVLSDIVYVINGTKAVSDLRGNTKEGDTVQVSFTVRAGVEPREFTLVSYTAPGSTFDPSTASQQEIFDTDTGPFGPGSYTLMVSIPHSYFQVDFVCGSAIDHLGPANSNIFYSAQTRLFSADNGGRHTLLANASSLSGFAYADANNNGVLDAGELAITGVAVVLSGRDSKGKSVNLAAVTDVDGQYLFDNLPAGKYAITETQPEGYADGADTIGTLGGSMRNDKFTSISLSAGVDGANYNFGELQAVDAVFAASQTVATAFWTSSSGQNLIQSTNGSQSAKNLGNWLATNFGNLYGTRAGSANNLSGKTNSQVAAYVITLDANAARKAEVEALALALNVYVTNSLLAGNVATSYGFSVSASGLVPPPSMSASMAPRSESTTIP